MAVAPSWPSGGSMLPAPVVTEVGDGVAAGRLLAGCLLAGCDKYCKRDVMRCLVVGSFSMRGHFGAGVAFGRVVRPLNASSSAASAPSVGAATAGMLARGSLS